MDEGLMGVVAKLPLERNFKLEHVKEVDPYGLLVPAPSLMLLYKIPACCKMQHCNRMSKDANPGTRHRQTGN